MRLLLPLAILAAAGCSSAESTPQGVRRGGTSETPGGTNPDDKAPATGGEKKDAPPPAGTTVGSDSWTNGKQITSNITIATGATVEIAPGAAITVGPGVAITVQGTLHLAAGGAAHAKLTGTNWSGLVIASGGKVDVDGLDLENVQTALWTQTGNADAIVKNATITAAVPFKMEAGSKLSLSHARVTATQPSAIAGTFVASYMDYDKTSAEGLELSDKDGSMTISDSTLHGAGGGDYVVSRAGKLVKVEYTTISGSHCGLHFDAVDKFVIDHVSDDQNTWGAMLYGSGNGPSQILSSNVRNSSKDLDMQGTNGPLTIEKSYTGGKNVLQPSARVTSPAAAPVADARPRGATP